LQRQDFILQTEASACRSALSWKHKEKKATEGMITMKYLLVCLLLICSAVDAKEKPYMIKLVESACYGSCPGYEIVLFEDGVFLFNGFAYTEAKGLYRDDLGPDKFTEIENLLYDYGYFNFVDDYGVKNHQICSARWTDDSQARITVYTASQSKAVKYYRGCRGFKDESMLIALIDVIKHRLSVNEYINSKLTGHKNLSAEESVFVLP